MPAGYRLPATTRFRPKAQRRVYHRESGGSGREFCHAEESGDERFAWDSYRRLLIGVFATWRRGYFSSSEANCATAGSMTLTVVVGPLNHAGVNPKVANCNVPQPSQ